jgi:hypothetical protein
MVRRQKRYDPSDLFEQVQATAVTAMLCRRFQYGPLAFFEWVQGSTVATLLCCHKRYGPQGMFGRVRAPAVGATWRRRKRYDSHAARPGLGTARRAMSAPALLPVSARQRDWRSVPSAAGGYTHDELV